MNRKALLSAVLIAAVPGAAWGKCEVGPAPELKTWAQPEAADAGQQEDTLYAQGTKAMDEQRWSDAVTAFDGVAAAKGKRADAGLYWKAYSLDKLGRRDEARAVCTGLAKQAPSSTWNKECFVLRARTTVDPEQMRELAKLSSQLNVDLGRLNVDVGPKWGGYDPQVYYKGNRPTTEDDIKLLALNSLMRQDPAKALPLLRDMLHSDKSVDVKRQALFVLSRSKDPQAQTILTETATANGDPKVQIAAIEIVAIGRGKDAGPTLVQVYHSTTDAGVKRAAMNGLFIAHDAPGLVELARGEKDLNLKRDIVSQLSLMNDPAATDYMLELLK